MPDAWAYRDEPERPRHPRTELVPESPQRYSQTEHMARLAPRWQGQPLAPGGQPAFTPAVQPQYPHGQNLPPAAPPAYWGQPVQPGYPQQPAVVYVQQPAQWPTRAVTKQGLGPFWVIFHLVMTCMTCGLWAVIWYWHARSRRSYTTFS